jgi:hypothetical protein
MGYSIGIRVSNPKLRKKMLAFMGEHYRKWSDVIGKGETISSGNPTDDLSYDSSSKALGFDYASHCSGWESCFIYSMTRWMALKIGDHKSKIKREGEKTWVFPKPVPYMVYDGFESWPILVVASLKGALRLPKDKQWCAMDKCGVYIAPEVNHILTHHCSDIFGSPAYDKMMKAMAKLKRPEHNPDDSTAYDAWMEKREAVKVKYMRPEIDRMLPKVRAEIHRLDKLWATYKG